MEKLQRAVVILPQLHRAGGERLSATLAGGTRFSLQWHLYLVFGVISVAVSAFLQESSRQQRLNCCLELLNISLFLSLSSFTLHEQTATHSFSLSHTHTYTHIGTAEHHTLLAGYLLQMRRGGLRWWLPQPPLAVSRHLSLLSRFFPLPLTVNWWAAVKDALFLLRWPGKRCSTATNKQPYAGLITSSGAAFNSLTSALWLNKGSAIATDLIGGWRYICFFLSFFITA